jgi:hypothetical protein
MVLLLFKPRKGLMICLYFEFLTIEIWVEGANAFDESEAFTLGGGIVLFRGGEKAARVAYRMHEAIESFLREDEANLVIRGVAFEEKRFVEIRVSENWSGN